MAAALDQDGMAASEEARSPLVADMMEAVMETNRSILITFTP
jgi:hypothetical protein